MQQCNPFAQEFISARETVRTRQRAALNAARAASNVHHLHEPAIPSDQDFTLRYHAITSDDPGTHTDQQSLRWRVCLLKTSTQIVHEILCFICVTLHVARFFNVYLKTHPLYDPLQYPLLFQSKELLQMKCTRTIKPDAAFAHMSLIVNIVLIDSTTKKGIRHYFMMEVGCFSNTL